jgi:D-arabinose 1-dehydrogenase-like Zn-dependent alcohol dehydrogenase
LRKIGVSHVQSSIDLESLKSNEGKYDLVINTLFIDNEEIYKSYQHLTAPGGVYVMLGLPSSTTEFKIDLDYMIQNEITTAGSIVGSMKDVKEMLEFSHNHNIECSTETYTFDKFNEAVHRAEKERPIFRVVINVTDWAKQNGFDK